MPPSPLLDREGVLHLVVECNGRRLPGSIGVVSVHVHRAVGAIPTAQLVVEDGDLQDDPWPLADGDTFEPGSRIRIAAGYGDRDEPVFEGIVVQLGMQISGERGGRLVVDCCHPAMAMTVERRNASYADQTDSDVIAGIIGRHGLAAAVDPTGATPGGLTQYGCSDWDFVCARAEANGLLVIAADDGGTVIVQAPQVDREPVLQVQWGVDLIDFQADVDAQHAWGSVPAGGREPAAIQPAQRTAGSMVQRLGADLVRKHGRMTFPGSGLARVGALIDVSGVGLRFGGRVFVGAVDHEIAAGNWVTTVAFGLAPHGSGGRRDGTAPAASGRLLRADGLQTGVVVRLDGDPAGEGRIQIELPALAASPPAVWARLAQFQASGGFGAFFVPEVGDDVVVGFFDHDPAQPVVLGSLYGSRNRPAYALAAPNDTKALVTRSRHRIEFDDKDKVITVTTPSHNRVVLSDKDRCIRLEDQNGNRVELGGSGIRLDTPGDLKITAGGSISVDAEGALRIASRADVRCAGLNVACDAQVGFSGKGGATAELSAAGQTTVTGALVMIN